MTAKNLSVLAGVMILCSLCSCGKKEEVKAKPVRPVKWIVLGKGNAKFFANLPGEVQATQRSHLAFQVSGQIIELPIIIGQQVKKGQLLARLNDKTYMNEFNKAQAFERKAKVDYLRYKQLNKDKVVSDKEYEQKRRNYVVAITNRKTAQKNKNDTSLKAPFDGIIASKSVKNYQNVKAEEKIIFLQNLNHLEIVVHVPVREMKPGYKGKLDMHAVVNNFPKEKFDLKTREFSTEIDQDTMTYEMTLEMLIPEKLKNKVLPGMLANVFISKKEAQKLKDNFLIPVQAIITNAKGNKFVWVINPDTMQVNKRQVTTNVLVDNDIIVTSGLKDKEMVAVSGVNYLIPNQKVKKYQRIK
jgi:RND family efflux transporter MFP subunit